MAHYLDFTDGTFTVASSTNIFLTEYTPQTPATRYEQIKGVSDGGELGAAYYDNVTETVEGAMYTSSFQSNYVVLQRLMEAAKERQRTRTGAKVYIRYQIDGSSDIYRSEILTGRVELVKGAMSIWGNQHLPIRIHITRRYFWEHVDETELQLASQASGTPATGGKTIHNHKDSGQGNYVEIAAAQVVGAIPAPVRIRLQNNTGSTQDYRNVYLAVNANSSPSTFSHIIEGENFDAGGVGAPVNNTTNSSDAYVSGSFNTTGDYFKWVLSAGLLSVTRGRWFRLMARFHGYSAQAYIRPIILDNDGFISLYRGDEVLLPASQTELIDLGMVPLPPAGYDSAAGAHMLGLYCRSVSGSATLNLDFIQLTPVESYRHLVMRGNDVANGDAIEDDGPEGRAYHDLAGAHHYIMSPRGASLTVFPNLIQRIYVLHDEGFSANIDNSFLVRAYYRPRRLTI